MITNTTNVVTMLDGLPEMIEASERRGQSELVASTLLPRPGEDQAYFEACGFKFGAQVEGDPLFQHAELPPGWTKKASDHAMWSYIYDEQGRERASVFYKAAFYDRRAGMSATSRYKVDTDYSRTPGPKAAKVIDLKTGAVLHEVSKNGKGASGEASYAACEWLKENVPNCSDPMLWLRE